MGQLALGVAGAVIGSFFGPLGSSIGFALGSAVGGYLFAPDGPTVEGPRLSDLTAPGGAEGTGIPIVRGTVRVPGRVIWSTPIIETRHEEEVEGGKGGPSGPTQVTYTYSISFAVSLCDGGPNGITGVRRLWADSKLFYSVADGADPATFAANTERGTIRFYLGTESQMPDPLIAAAVGNANAPAFRGLAHVVFDTLQLQDFANHRPNIEAEVVMAGANAFPTYTHSQASYDWARICIDPRRGKVILTEQNPGAADWIWRWSGGADAPVRLAQYPASAAAVSSITCDEIRDELVVFSNNGPPGLGIVRFDAATGAHLGTEALNPLGTSNAGNSESLRFNVEAHYDRINQCFWTLADGSGSGQVYLVRIAPWDGLNAVHAVINLGGWAPTGPGANHTPMVDGAGKVWLCSNDAHLVLASAAPVSYTLPAAGLQATAFLWRARGEIWVARSSNHASLGWMVLNLGTLTFSNSVDLGLGSWTTTYQKGIENAIGRAWFIGAGVDGELRNTDGTLVKSFDNLFASGVETLQYLAGVVVVNTLTVARSFFEDSLAVSGVLLSNLVTDISVLAGAGTVTASSLSGDTVRGYEMSNPMPARGALEPLMGAFNFDAVEHDGGLAYIKRGGASVATFTVDDLGAHIGDAAENSGAPVTITRMLESELPAAITLTFANQDLDYNVGVARARRLVSQAQNVTQIQFPIVFTSAEASAAVDRIMRYAWLERERFQFALRPRWRILEPTDVVTLPDGQRVRITKIDYAPNGPVRCEAVSDDSGALTSYAVGNGAEVGTGVTIGSAGPSTGIVLDIPLLLDSHEDEGLYVGAGGESASWNGAVIYVSRDNGASWQGMTPTANALAIGAVMSGAMVAGPIGAQWDHASRITVRIVHPGLTLSNPASLDTLYNGANSLAIGSNGEDWEIVQYNTVVANSDGTYTLSDFLRGRKGTEWATTAWTTGARIVGLESGPVKRVLFPLAAIGTASLWKAATFGASLADAAPDEETFNAVSCLPYSPVEVGGAKLATNDFNLRWTRRARRDAEWRNSVNVPLDEPTEEYSVDILDEDFVAVKRTVQVLALSTLTYTSAQATADFGSSPAAIGVRVYQISNRVGRGYGGQAVVGREVDTALRFSKTLKSLGMTLASNRFSASKNTDATYDWAPAERGYREGRWYFEVKLDSLQTPTPNRVSIGITNRSTFPRSVWDSSDSFLATSDGNIIFGTGGFTYAAGDVVQVAWDATNGRVYFGKNGSWQNGADPSLGTSPQATYTPSVSWRAVVVGSDGGKTFTTTARFGSGHNYTIPTGYVPLN